MALVVDARTPFDSGKTLNQSAIDLSLSSASHRLLISFDIGRLGFGNPSATPCFCAYQASGKQRAHTRFRTLFGLI